eukprot:TRINITY_DN3789_c0_g1_i6.p1 TRINITY_DN3789_c0_g1~~TRINITY_DN3789_c0_g1_i6.p1  ORF type:complete len:1159 (-),score=293.43 TRINITY_DN3789_c0_g1_i6:71-3547(-)
MLFDWFATEAGSPKSLSKLAPGGADGRDTQLAHLKLQRTELERLLVSEQHLRREEHEKNQELLARNEALEGLLESYNSLPSPSAGHLGLRATSVFSDAELVQRSPTNCRPSRGKGKAAPGLFRSLSTSELSSSPSMSVSSLCGQRLHQSSRSLSKTAGSSRSASKLGGGRPISRSSSKRLRTWQVSPGPCLPPRQDSFLQLSQALRQEASLACKSSAAAADQAASILGAKPSRSSMASKRNKALTDVTVESCASLEDLRTSTRSTTMARARSKTSYESDLERQWEWECSPWTSPLTSPHKQGSFRKLYGTAAEAQSAWIDATLKSIPSEELEWQGTASKRPSFRKLRSDDDDIIIEAEEYVAVANEDAASLPAVSKADHADLKRRKSMVARKSMGARKSMVARRSMGGRTSFVVKPKNAPAWPPSLEERKDEFYGFGNLSERMEQVQRSFFGDGDVFDDATSRQRVKQLFQRFRRGSGTDIVAEDLPEIARFLGFVPKDDEEVMMVLRQVTEYNELDVNEFSDFMEKYTLHQFQWFKELFDEFDEDGSGEIEVGELRRLMSAMGFVVSRPMIEEALAVVDDGNGELSFEEFIQFMTVYNHTEGFTHPQLAEMHKVFRSFASRAGIDELPFEEIASALISVFGLESECHAYSSARGVTPKERDTSAVAGISFPEFLMCAKHLRLAEERDFRRVFEKFDGDGSGSIDRDELALVMADLGYKPMRAVINEVIMEVDFDGEGDLDYEEFCHFMGIFRQRDGFTLKELDQFLLAFSKCDEDGSDSIDAHEFGSMLRYLGYIVEKDDLDILLSEVDADKSGELDSKEFLRLMRTHRETDLKRLQMVFDRFCRMEGDKPSLKADLLPVEMIYDAVLEGLGPDSSSKYAKLAVKGMLRNAADFQDYVIMVDTGHWAKVMDDRKMAGFTSSEIATLQEMFERYDEDGSGDIDASEVQKLLHDFGLHCRTREERQASLDQVDDAKKLAREAGVFRDGEDEGAFMTFWELVQLVRLVKNKKIAENAAREQEVIDKLPFTRTEIGDFRVVFLQWMRMENSAASEKKVAEAAGCMLEVKDNAISLMTFVKLLKSLGLNVIHSQRMQIESQWAKVDTQVDSESANQNAKLTFIGFLQMMNWMLDTDFAGIKGVTSKQVEKSQEQFFKSKLSG